MSFVYKTAHGSTVGGVCTRYWNYLSDFNLSWNCSLWSSAPLVVLRGSVVAVSMLTSHLENHLENLRKTCAVRPHEHLRFRALLRHLMPWHLFCTILSPVVGTGWLHGHQTRRTRSRCLGLHTQFHRRCFGFTASRFSVVGVQRLCYRVHLICRFAWGTGSEHMFAIAT